MLYMFVHNGQGTGWEGKAIPDPSNNARRVFGLCFFGSCRHPSCYLSLAQVGYKGLSLAQPALRGSPLRGRALSFASGLFLTTRSPAHDQEHLFANMFALAITAAPVLECAFPSTIWTWTITEMS